VTQAILAGEQVFLLEGEKDCDRAAEELGLVATTCPMGAETWRASYTQMLRDARVVLVPDNDRAGRQHMDSVGRDLLEVAKSVKRVDLPELPEKGDLSDWIDAGGTRAELLELAEQAPNLFKSDLQGTEAPGRNKSLPFYTVGQIKDQSGGDNEQGWICPMFMKAGDITLFGGEAKKSGKTTFYMHMLKAVHDGVPFMDMPTVQTNSLVLTEQGGNIIEATNKAKIADDDKILITPYKDVAREEWPHLIKLAVECCKENDLGILVIDTFTAFAKLRGSDENLSGEIIERMLPLLDAARVHGLHVSILHHTGYNGEIRGSSAFWKDPDCIWLLKRPPGDHAPNIRALHGEGRYDMVHTGFNIALEENGYVLLGTNSQIERAKAKTTLLEKIPVGKDNAVRRTAVFEDLPKPPAETTYQRALEDLIEAHAVQEETLKERGNPKILWRPQGVPVTQEEKEDDLFKSDPQGMAESERNKSEDPAPEFITDQVQVEALAERAHAGAHVALDLEGDLDAKINRLRGKEGIRVLSLHLAGETHLLDLHAVDPTPLLKVLEDTPLYVHGAEFDIAALHHRYGFVPKHAPRDTLNLSRLVYAGEEI
jgi:hypothetical protein